MQVPVWRVKFGLEPVSDSCALTGNSGGRGILQARLLGWLAILGDEVSR